MLGIKCFVVPLTKVILFIKKELKHIVFLLSKKGKFNNQSMGSLKRYSNLEMVILLIIKGLGKLQCCTKLREIPQSKL